MDICVFHSPQANKTFVMDIYMGTQRWNPWASLSWEQVGKLHLISNPTVGKWKSDSKMNIEKILQWETEIFRDWKEGL